MSCGVAVMNKRGLALAADSAVVLGDAEKIYKTAEKLFPLSLSVPVGIMHFGAVDIVNMPWETVVKIYAQKLGSRRFDTLSEYASDFLGFIDASKTLFPAEEQEEQVGCVIYERWSGYRRELTQKIAQAPKPSKPDPALTLAGIIRKDHKYLTKLPDLPGLLGPGYGADIVKLYADVIDQVEADVFKGIKLSPQARHDLRENVSLMYCKEWFNPGGELVIAGMGDDEPFPMLLHYRVGTVAAGKLRYKKAGEIRIGHDTDAFIKPFSQAETIAMIIDGIHPALEETLIDDVERWLPAIRKKRKGPKARRTRDLKEDIAKRIREISESHWRPVVGAVAALPRQDLAKMAEALVSLTAFLMRMSADQSETVAEPIDVAVLSKGDGFTWVKHKGLLQQAGGLAL